MTAAAAALLPVQRAAGTTPTWGGMTCPILFDRNR
jgi:hypothetical protein